ncbi:MULTISPECIES: T7SS effector LXG polymorphic toxin [Peribacillus]|uniref:T7SS effector LXG polymorphic toxin n=1 Tax=Peribacillus TaxID=2675229 RepID=UPI001F4D72A3|nr:MULTISPECIES: T7SS effector LXG polymorphic toxin [unclassified Peribacillus]MCK1983220.1 T7SS effector LXG polymorphic toxin [Peribacillus sp. Aquil_B1]MCK2006237.1 T7SS effector LXG polymorphic toxin [Peribacillus sp. Aquil_B8]
MKIYDAKTLTAATKSRAKQYEELKNEVAALKKEFQGIVGLDNEFQGAGAAAIKSFYEAQIEVADAWMELFTTQISFLEGIPASLEEADLSGNTVVEIPFLDGEVSNGINQAKSLVDQQANDLQRVLDSIYDILPLDMFDQKDFNEKITLAGHTLDDTMTKVENVDRQLVEEYDVSIGQENVAVGLFRALLDATKQDGTVSPMTFNQSAFKNSVVYQVKDEVAGQMKDYQTFKKQQAEARKIEQEMEELENRPWYEKAWDTTKTFTGEFTGYYDSIRASTGVDPVTGRKLSDAERIAAGAMAAAGFIPVVGWAGRAIKGGSALYKTAKGLNAANHALDAYKSTKGFSLLQKTEYGIYGLLAANGLGEAVTGKDMFGNQLTEEQRQNGLLMALGIGGVAGAAKVADKVARGTKFVPYSKEFAQRQVQKVQATITDIARSGKTTLKNIGEELSKKEIPKRISVEQVSLAGGPNLPQVVMEKQTIKEAYQKFTVKDSKVEGVSGESISKGTGNRLAGESEVITLVRKGEQYTNGRKNRLKPNIRYQTGEFDYLYETDNAGRLVKFETEKLQLTTRTDRLSHSKNTPGKIKGQDHAGHLAGDRFGGSPKIDNLVSQLSDVNLKQYKKIEYEWAAALKETPPKEVTINLEVIYSGNNTRPEKFLVKYTIDGESFSEVLLN